MSQDKIWLSAFQEGYSKAWDTMMPLLMEGIQKSKKAIHDAAVDETLARLESVIVSRIEQSEKYDLKPVNEILALKKRVDERVRNSSAQEKERFQHHLEIIDWVLDGRTVR